MKKKIISKILLIAFVACFGTMIVPKEAQAGCESGYYEWMHYIGMNSCDGNLVDYYLIHECAQIYLYKVVYYFHSRLNKWKYLKTESAPLFGKWNLLQLINGNDNKEFIEIIAMDNLQIKSNIDVACDIYELETGRLILENINISASSSFNTIEAPYYINKSSAYCIVAQNSDRIIATQIFYFNNQNQIIKGVIYE